MKFQDNISMPHTHTHGQADTNMPLLFQSWGHNQLTGISTTRGERRLISIRCLKDCVEGKSVISCRMMHNLVKIYHVLHEL